MNQNAKAARAVGANTSNVGAETLFALGNLCLVLGILAGVALIIAIAVLGMDTGVPNWVAVAGVAGAASFVANGVVAWAVLHWYGNSQTLLEGIHSNLFLLAESTLGKDPAAV